ncbi:Protein of unknown function [Actinopolyspora mzabensis]|uniref:SMODS and SLOG-associating 2TM effector domain-containing protein n=1 Tax=Actinopolyspora mzabensis TaxID=995066 RepID=A0A1G9B014_ACTMZ|nr:DUF4231 domain-containing protein [Actinopolyspora mzabensis]SDK32300.1 Protein of unknown function [Actinopolyspora mzabensis]
MSSTEVSTGIVGGGVLSAESDPDDVARRIADLSEQVHRALLLRRLLAVWALPANVALVALTVSWFALGWSPGWKLSTLVSVIPMISVVGSAFLLYRQYFKVRDMAIELRELNQARREQSLDDVGSGGDLLAAHKRYRAYLPDAIRAYRRQARRLRRAHNALQVVIISGAIVTSVIAAISVTMADVRWAVVGVSLLVALTAALSGFAKYRERGVNLQQTADALEREYHSVELRVGKYRRFDSEQAAYAEFAHEAEVLLDEHAKRQQQVGPAMLPDALV